MQRNGKANPFGPPVVTARPLVTTLHRSTCGSPSALAQDLAGEPGAEGLALLESAGAGPERTTIRKTALITRPLLRLRIRGRRAELESLNGAGGPLVERLRPALVAEVVDGEDMEDLERLGAPSVLDFVRTVAGSVADRQPTGFPPGLFGAFSYELVDQFEPLPARKPDPLDEEDASFVLAGDMILEDLAERTVSVITRGMPWEEAEEVERRHLSMVRRLRDRSLPEIGDEEAHRGGSAFPAAGADDAFREGVREFRERIGCGEIFQGVLSRGITIPGTADPFSVYRVLRSGNPSPYMFYLDLGDGVLLGASPETCLRVEDGCVEIRPIAGTAPRGLDPAGQIDEELDGRLAMGMLLDTKEQAEHAMLLDLARNDVARIAAAGSTRVIEQFAVERYSHVQHLVSRVRGRLRPGLDAMHAYRAAANMGTLTGAPKPRAMTLIRDQEPTGRGYFGGAAGYLLQDGRFESCIVIRSLRFKDGAYHTRAGAGIVWDSDPEREFLETEQKLAACRQAVATASEAAP